MASLSGERLKYLRNDFSMLEMTQECDKQHIFGKRQIYEGNGLSI